MTENRHTDLLRHLRRELAARKEYLAFWEKQDPIEVYSPPMMLVDIRSNLIEAAKVEIQVIEHAIQILERSDTVGP